MIKPALSVLLSVLFVAGPALACEEKTETLTISHPWTRATAPSQKVGAVFMEISTIGDTTDRLIGVESPDAEIVQIHRHTMVDGVVRMRPVDGVDIPAKGEAVLKPGGLHIMLINLKAPLLEETVIPLTLKFEKAGTVAIEAVVEAAGARAASSVPEDSHSGHGSIDRSGHGSEHHQHGGHSGHQY